MYMCLEYHVFKSVYWPGLYLEVMRLNVFTLTFIEPLEVVLFRLFKGGISRIEIVHCWDENFLTWFYNIYRVYLCCEFQRVWNPQ